MSQPPTLTLDPWQFLASPFAFDEHDFLQGNPYIQKQAIRARLNRVDPRWSISPPVLVTVADDVVVMSATLTLLGASRGNVGTGKIQHPTPDKDGVINAYTAAGLLAKAIKQAASDCLPRCAEQFGVGTYLKGLSKEQAAQIKTPAGLKRYLDSLSGTVGTTPHWSKTSGAAFNARLRELQLDPARVLAELEPGRRLASLSDITLSEADAFARLEQLAQADPFEQI